LYLYKREGSQHHIFLCEYVSGEPHLPPDAPEAAEGPNNRFKPQWLLLSDLAAAPFLIWQPIKDQLLTDLDTGFAEDVVEIVAAPAA
jgi:hypothetical protein